MSLLKAFKVVSTFYLVIVPRLLDGKLFETVAVGRMLPWAWSSVPESFRLSRIEKVPVVSSGVIEWKILSTVKGD